MERVQFCAYGSAERDEIVFIEQFRYGDRHDFAVGRDFCGIAARVEFHNRHISNGAYKGVRRKVTCTLVDCASRCAVATRQVSVCMGKDEFVKFVYLNFPVSPEAEMGSGRGIPVSPEGKMDSDQDFPVSPEGGMNPDRAYRLVVCDEAARETLGVSTVRLFSREVLGDPADWYEARSGGVRPGWEMKFYRSVDAAEVWDYYVSFCLMQKMGPMPPLVLPEVEIRLFQPDGTVSSMFREPVCHDFSGNNYWAEFLFEPDRRTGGVYYAELRSMGVPIAGIVFRTDGPEEAGEWHGEDVLPLGAYSPEEAEARFTRHFPPQDTAAADDDEFDALLDRFIASEKERAASEEEPDSADSTADSASGEAPQGSIREDSASGKPSDGSIREDSTPAKPSQGNPWEDSAPGEPSQGNPWDDSTPGKPSQESIRKDSTPVKPSQAEAGGNALLPSALDRLTGLRPVKERLATYERVVRFNKMRADNGLPTSPAPLHAMFLGSPGTGKTTVARMMGVMLHRAGLLSRGHVVARERATLLGQFYSSESEKTLEAIEEARGGILFIDEAYQLFQPSDPKDPGKFVIETLLTALSDPDSRDWMLILAGYPDEMRRMLDMNPGFKSRIPESNVYIFPDFTEPELMEIAENYLARNSYTLADDARAALRGRLAEDCARRGKNLGNARHVMNLIQTEILPAMAVRVTSEGLTDAASLTEIRLPDIPRVIPLQSPRRHRIGFAS